MTAAARRVRPESRRFPDCCVIDRPAIGGYRSLRDLRLEIGALNVVTGPNGSGKSSLYRALRLLADIAQGRIIQSLAREGGLQSTLWAGPATIARAIKHRRYPVEGLAPKSPVSLKLGFSGDGYGYAIDLGLPHPSPSQFMLDPEIKTENVWSGERRVAFVAAWPRHRRQHDDPLRRSARISSS